jgi:hypothetical protein
MFRMRGMWRLRLASWLLGGIYGETRVGRGDWTRVAIHIDIKITTDDHG